MGQATRAFVVAFLMLGLSGTPSLAGSLRADAARTAREAGLQGAAERTRIPPKYLWTGVGLLGGGGLTMLLGFAVDHDCGLYEDDCQALGTGYKVLGGAMAGTGALLLALGAAKRETVPTVAYRRGGFVIQQTVGF
jgi:hypothetical protein